MILPGASYDRAKLTSSKDLLKIKLTVTCENTLFMARLATNNIKFYNVETL